VAIRLGADRDLTPHESNRGSIHVSTAARAGHRRRPCAVVLARVIGTTCLEHDIRLCCSRANRRVARVLLDTGNAHGRMSSGTRRGRGKKNWICRGSRAVDVQIRTSQEQLMIYITWLRTVDWTQSMNTTRSTISIIIKKTQYKPEKSQTDDLTWVCRLRLAIWYALLACQRSGVVPRWRRLMSYCLLQISNTSFLYFFRKRKKSIMKRGLETE